MDPASLHPDRTKQSDIAHADAFEAALSTAQRQQVMARWPAHGVRLVETMHTLYGGHPHADEALHALLHGAATLVGARSPALLEQDCQRERDPRWALGADTIGYSAYVDRFAGTLRGVAGRVPYLQALGVRYLHLLPFQLARRGDSDGGFAVRDYDAIEPALGTLDDLAALTARLREARISLCADFVLNHTSDDHRWALAARDGDARYRGYYLAYPDRGMPDRHERTLREVFPRTAPGNFSAVDGLGWVWTTFYPYQWDLDWSNPRVFTDMALTLQRMANRGIEVFRLDSTAFLWKREGTDSMNQPEAHLILQALRALVDLLAPGVLLKAEAIVPTRELPPYFGSGSAAGRECQLAYNSTLMAASWAALAERRGDILRDVVERMPPLPAGCAWINYVRCHDDIGWGVLAEEAKGDAHRPGFDLQHVARYYAGNTVGSNARGRSFQSDASNAAHRSNGMASALAGIAGAQASDDAVALARAERLLLLLHGIALSVAGLPLLYMGDELALGNDEHFEDDPLHRDEGRWLHRPMMDWPLADAAAAALDVGDDANTTASSPAAVASRVRRGLQRLIAVRSAHPALAADAPMRALPLTDPALFGIARGDRFVALFNLGDAAATLTALPDHASGWRDAIDGSVVTAPLVLEEAGMRWLVAT